VEHKDIPLGIAFIVLETNVVREIEALEAK